MDNNTQPTNQDLPNNNLNDPTLSQPTPAPQAPQPDIIVGSSVASPTTLAPAPPVSPAPGVASPMTPPASAPIPPTPPTPGVVGAQPSVITGAPVPSTGTSTLNDWPGAFGIYKISKAAVTLNLGAIIAVAAMYLVLYVIDLVISFVLKSVPLKDVFSIIYEILGIILSASSIYLAIEGVKGNKVSLGAALSKSFSKFLYIFVVSILTAVIAAISLLLLIVPFFFIVPRIYLALYYVIDQNLGPIKAIEASWEHTKGNVGKAYGILGVSILIVLPSVTIIGILATIYFGLFYYAAGAVYYMYVNNQNKLSSPVQA